MADKSSGNGMLTSDGQAEATADCAEIKQRVNSDIND